MNNDNIDFLENIKRRERKNQMLIYAFVGICLLFGLAILYFVNKAKTAEKNAIENAEKAHKAEGKAVALKEYLNDNQKYNEDLIRLKDSLLSVCNGNKVAKDAEKVIVQDTVANIPIVKEVTILKRNSAILTIPSQVLSEKYIIRQKTIIYIQAYGGDGEVIGNTLKNRLRKRDFIVPNVEIIDRKDGNRVTYFFDEDRAYAERISEELIHILHDAKIDFDAKKYIPQKSSLKAKQRQIEVWVSF